MKKLGELLGRRKKYTDVRQVSGSLVIGFSKYDCAFGFKSGNKINWYMVDPHEMISIFYDQSILQKLKTIQSQRRTKNQEQIEQAMQQEKLREKYNKK